MIRFALLLTVLAAPVSAFELSLPFAAKQTAQRDTDPDRYAAPVGVFAEGQVPSKSIEGAVRRSAWRLDSPGLTPFQIIRPLKAQLEAAGFEITLDCASAVCGGFDFRFGTEVLSGPNMYVNIRGYHFLTALSKSNDGVARAVVTVLASASSASAYIQVIQAGVLDEDAVTPIARPNEVALPLVTGVFAERLLQQGHLVLDDLVFGSGSSDLSEGPFAALQELAAFLKERPEVRVALVGHTDSVGGLDGNIALSKRRAQSVRRRMIETYAVPAAQLEAEGMGYLSPIASNLEAMGRDANRRVEVVLLSVR